MKKIRCADGCRAFDKKDQICVLAYLMKYSKKEKEPGYEWIAAEDCANPMSEAELHLACEKRRHEEVVL